VQVRDPCTLTIALLPAHQHWCVYSLSLLTLLTVITSFRVSENSCQRMRLLHLMNTSCLNFSVMSLVLSGWNILPAVVLKIRSSGEEARIDSTVCRSSHMRIIRSVWLPPRQWIIVILEHCGSKIIRKLLAHGQRKISMIWLAALTPVQPYIHDVCILDVISVLLIQLRWSYTNSKVDNGRF